MELKSTELSGKGVEMMSIERQRHGAVMHRIRKGKDIPGAAKA